MDIDWGELFLGIVIGATAGALIFGFLWFMSRAR